MRIKTLAYLLLAISVIHFSIFADDETKTNDQAKMISFKAFSESPEIYEATLLRALKEAKEDYEKGKPKYITYGLQSPRGRSWTELLKTQYGFKISSYGCVVGEEGIVYTSTYNEMTRRLFLTKKDVDLEKIRQDYEKSLETKSAEQGASHNERKRSS